MNNFKKELSQLLSAYSSSTKTDEELHLYNSIESILKLIDAPINIPQLSDNEQQFIALKDLLIREGLGLCQLKLVRTYSSKSNPQLDPTVYFQIVRAGVTYSDLNRYGVLQNTDDTVIGYGNIKNDSISFFKLYSGDSPATTFFIYDFPSIRSYLESLRTSS